MSLPKKIKSNKSETNSPENFISFNLLIIKGKLTDPETQRLLLKLMYRLLMFLIVVLIAKTSPENIPFIKTLIELTQHLK
ncbi:MAG: hypothetical protein EPO28_10670 [Saprospiraceae bacterium]|nr:MAG: hypothetical protein EPO28_10670 [Saprospiraceae bacterium]